MTGGRKNDQMDTGPEWTGLLNGLGMTVWNAGKDRWMDPDNCLN